MAYPQPSNVAPWYLRNINQALALDSASGNVYLRTNATFVGNVSVSNVSIGALGNVDLTHTYLPVSVTGNITGITSAVSVTGNVNAAVTGNVNAVVTGNVGIIGNVNVTQGTSPWSVTGNVGITGNANVVLAQDANVIISGFAGAAHDAFGRLRVSEPATLFDTQSRYFNHNQFASNTVGTANVVYVSNQSSFQFNVGTASGDSAVQETTTVFPYQPGKSQLTLNTFCFATPKTNLRQRVGLFGASDGVFFENDGTYNYMVIRSGASGTEERVRQDAWNGDRLNGSGGTTNPSGITLYPDRVQIYFADVEWLGVGSVRVGFVINGNFIICHTFNHANQSGNTKVYMTTATLPVRYEITNAGATANASMMTQICSSVISEGGYQLKGIPASIGHSLGTPVRLPNDTSFKPLIAIRLKSTNLDAVVLPTNFTISPVASSTFKYRIYRRAVTTGGTWTDYGNTSSVEYNLAPTAIASGVIGDESFIISSNQSSAAPSNQALSFAFQLERNSFTGLAYEYVISVATTGTNQDVYASIQWQEVS